MDALVRTLAWQVRELPERNRARRHSSSGKSLHVPLGDLPSMATQAPAPPAGAPVTLADAEREQIVGALRDGLDRGRPKGAQLDSG